MTIVAVSRRSERPRRRRDARLGVVLLPVLVPTSSSRRDRPHAHGPLTSPEILAPADPAKGAAPCTMRLDHVGGGASVHDQGSPPAPACVD